ncbi:MAG: stage II sporulation protein R [Acetobacter sp.]|nr:stage II sporulation protein R [Acetobacter sp.]
MKYIISIISVIGLVAILCICALCGERADEPEYLRIHIRANSNSEVDQAVKYKVKDAVVEALIPLLSEVETKVDAEEMMRENFSLIESVANFILEGEGLTYRAHARLDNEFFPTRTYDGSTEPLTLKEGYYDSLILDLGTGEGNNWWCVVYPAFCFTKTNNFDNVVYISKILEIIQSITK